MTKRPITSIDAALAVLKRLEIRQECTLFTTQFWYKVQLITFLRCYKKRVGWKRFLSRDWWRWRRLLRDVTRGKEIPPAPINWDFLDPGKSE